LPSVAPASGENRSGAADGVARVANVAHAPATTTLKPTATAAAPEMVTAVGLVVVVVVVYSGNDFERFFSFIYT